MLKIDNANGHESKPLFGLSVPRDGRFAVNDGGRAAGFAVMFFAFGHTILPMLPMVGMILGNR